MSRLQLRLRRPHSRVRHLLPAPKNARDQHRPRVRLTAQRATYTLHRGNPHANLKMIHTSQGNIRLQARRGAAERRLRRLETTKRCTAPKPRIRHRTTHHANLASATTPISTQRPHRPSCAQRSRLHPCQLNGTTNINGHQNFFWGISAACRAQNWSNLRRDGNAKSAWHFPSLQTTSHWRSSSFGEDCLCRTSPPLSRTG